MYHSVIYPSRGKPRSGIATWQQSFFTWSAGNLADMGFEGASELRDWVSRFQVGQMTAPGYCWELGSAYSVQIRPGRKAPYYDSFDEVYRASFPDLVAAGCDAVPLNKALTKSKGKKRFDYPPRTMVGYPKSATGFVANFQPGLAAAANADLPDAAKAWAVFADRDTPTNYRWAPQFAIRPTKR